ncbi:MAG: DUF4295 family protein [Bacteroidota bacterium]
MAKTASNKEKVAQEKMAMVFVPVKNEKTGAYGFKKSIVPKEGAMKLFTKKGK